MDTLISILFGAGVAAWVYSKMSPRLGAGNTQNIVVLTGIIFVLAALFFYTIVHFILHIS